MLHLLCATSLAAAALLPQGWPLVVAAIGGAVVAGLAVALIRKEKPALSAPTEEAEICRLLVESADDAMGLFDPLTGRFTQVNPAAVRFFGAASREQLLTLSPWDVSPEYQPDGRLSTEIGWELITTAMERGSLRFNWMQRRLDGVIFHVEVSLTRITINGRPGMIFVLTDINDLKRMEESLRQNLERERELSELKNNFVSMVSHEFRTPLGIISSSAQILDRYFLRLGEDDRREHLAAITKSVRRMAGMMEDVLVLSRVEAGRMEFKPVLLGLGDFCRRLLDEHASAHGSAAAITLTIAPEVEAPATADETLLRHIITNLLGNAVKYSPPGAPVFLGMSREGQQVVITVRDEGLGIPEKDQALLFEAFHRGGNVGHIKGTGLGLVIVHRCCEIHGGTVVCVSREGAGATFTVRLPVF